MLNADPQPADALGAIALDPAQPDWNTQIDTLWAELGDPANAELFPAYFVKTVLPRIGGRVFCLTDATGARLGAALLFPRESGAGTRSVTVRLHAPAVTPAAALACIAPQIAPDQAVLYYPSDGRTFTASNRTFGPYAIGAPAAGELAAINALQRLVWGPEMGHGYPLDLHSAEFAPGSSLVARFEGRVVGFLFGFTRFTPPDGLPVAAGQRFLESQLLAIDPAHRRGGLAAALKRAQAEEALAVGIHAVHWTADPLQMANATLNFANLRAIAGKAYANYYPFTNALNLVAASRLGVVWLPGSAHGRAGLLPQRRERRDLADVPGVVVVNAGPEPLDAAAGAPAIAIEIPADWTRLQHTALELAQAWRTTTDTLLARYLGFTAGRYVICDVAREGERCYLVATAFTPELLN